MLGPFAWLAPEPFPRDLAEQSEILRNLFAAPSDGDDAVDIGDLLAELKTLSLIDLTAVSFEFHKLTLTCARASLPGEANARAFDASLLWLSNVLPVPDFDVSGWKIWGQLAPHLDAAIGMGGIAVTVGDALVRLCNQYGNWLFRQARHAQAEPLMRRALAISEKSYGAEHPNVATGLNNLAQLLEATNRLGEAEPLMRRALAIDEKSYGAEHPEVAIDLNNLAGLLQATNRLGEAEPLMRRALAIDEKSYGAEHPEVAIDLNNLAGLLQATNRLGEAEPLMRRALVILLRFTAATGHRHPNLVAGFRNYTFALMELSLAPNEIGQRLLEVVAEAKVSTEIISVLMNEISQTSTRRS